MFNNFMNMLSQKLIFSEYDSAGIKDLKLRPKSKDSFNKTLQYYFTLDSILEPED